MKSGKCVLGYKQTLKMIRQGKVKLVVLDKLCPALRESEIEYYATVAKTSVYHWHSVAQLYPALCDPMDCHRPGSSVLGIFQAIFWSGLPFPTPGDLPDPGIGPACLMSPALADRFFTTSVYRYGGKNNLELGTSCGESCRARYAGFLGQVTDIIRSMPGQTGEKQITHNFSLIKLARAYFLQKRIL